MKCKRGETLTAVYAHLKVKEALKNATNSHQCIVHILLKLSSSQEEENYPPLS